MNTTLDLPSRPLQTDSLAKLDSLRDKDIRTLLIYDGIIHSNNTPQAYLTARCHDAQTGGLIFCAADSANNRGQV
jgi:hypothetical protein